MRALQLTYDERLAVALEMIASAAAENRECPSNATIAHVIGYLETDCVSRCISALRDRGDLKVIRAGRYRVIEITSTGQRTLDPFDFVQEVVKRAAAVFNTTVKDIMSESRFREHVVARWAVMLTCRQLSYTYTMIGDALGRDHATVHHGVNGARDRMARNMDYRNRVTRLQAPYIKQEALAA